MRQVVNFVRSKDTGELVQQDADLGSFGSPSLLNLFIKESACYGPLGYPATRLSAVT